MQVPAYSPRAVRQRALLNAKLSYADGQISIPCTVTQISDTGAKVSLEESVSLPDRVRIEIFQRGVDSQARRVWRRGREAGFAFAGQEVADTAPTRAKPDRIRELEDEITSLRAVIADLKTQLRGRSQSY